MRSIENWFNTLRYCFLSFFVWIWVTWWFLFLPLRWSFHLLWTYWPAYVSYLLALPFLLPPLWLPSFIPIFSFMIRTIRIPHHRCSFGSYLHWVYHISMLFHKPLRNRYCLQFDFRIHVHFVHYVIYSFPRFSCRSSLLILSNLEQNA